MSMYEIKYNPLESAVKNSGKAEEEIFDCIDIISRKLMNKLNNLPGNDDGGYILSAADAISEKAASLTEKAETLATFGRDLPYVTETAWQADELVSEKIAELAEPYKEPLSFAGVYRSVTGFFYNVFCVDMAEFFGDVFPFGDKILGFLRETANDVSHWLDDVRNYFTHGNGQYIKNILVSIGTFIGAVFTVIGTVVAAATAGLYILAGLAIALGVIFLVYTFSNFMAATSDNTTALEHAGNGDTHLAHYYGSTDGITDWAKKKDFGDAKDNINMECAVDIFDTVGKTSEIGLDLVSIAVGALSLGNVYSKGGKKVIDHDYSWENIKKNIKKQYKGNLLDSGMDEVKVQTTSKNKTVTSRKMKLDLAEFLFNKESGFLDDLTGKDDFKRYKAYKKGADLVLDFFTDGKSDGLELVETMDSYWKDPTVDDGLKILSDGPSTFGGGSGNLVDSYTSPSLTFFEHLWELFNPSPA